jgi:transposase
MPAKTHHIRLSVEERASLEKLSRSNHRSEREKKRARMLLLCDANTPKEQGGSHTDAEVAQVLKCSSNTVYQLRHRVPDRGAIAVVTRAEQGHRKARKLDGAQEAHLVAVVCSTPPDGAARWSLKLLRERLLELEVVEHIGLETIRTTLKKMNLNPG